MPQDNNSRPVLPSFASFTSSLPWGAQKQLHHAPMLKRPGFGLPLNAMPSSHDRFPVLMGDQYKDWAAATLLIREVCMLKMIEDLTNKPDWWLKVHNPHIAARWKREALAMNWPAYRDHADFTPNMADACIQELRKKALLYDHTGLIPVLDYSACVVKSDKLLSPDLVADLMAAVKPLEDVPQDAKDWHPGSDAKVLDLVHPSLYPLVYGRSRILPHGQLSLGSCLQERDIGCDLPTPDASDLTASVYWGGTTIPSLSLKFQWLPCDVSINTQGQAKIQTYINNVHPVRHGQLYPIIQRFIQKSLPAWDLLYRWPKEFEMQRLCVNSARRSCTTPELCNEIGECRPWARPLNPDELLRVEEEPDDEGYDESNRGRLDKAWFFETHPLKLADAALEPHEGNNIHKCFFRVKPDDIQTRGFFRGASLIQVIVKLANIHLTPEKPSYDGGSWHIEGQLNEHICATALFYYDSDNISESHLAFRTPANAQELSGFDYEQNDIDSLARIFAIDRDYSATTLQHIGSVLTRPGRALFFPNLVQHRVEPFSLLDATRPGHRKILALFLVDPAIPIISTANVPPQQRHWWPSAEQMRSNSSLPPALAALVVHSVDYTMEEDEAKRIREELMQERTVLQTKTTETLPKVNFSFCEH
ncbi:hypothetical protein CDD82_4316 [Ophiocordyceps australis]|uniref:Uncharacterized protein n=1 Tax=Ophiocordyceps australis TaxID=1399860 RepID=A0A2C5Z978_9HYPO|nr:hypothetical protein CDD82_4316 [Ophiocordyceps australis]